MRKEKKWLAKLHPCTYMHSLLPNTYTYTPSTLQDLYKEVLSQRDRLAGEVATLKRSATPRYLNNAMSITPMTSDPYINILYQ